MFATLWGHEIRTMARVDLSLIGVIALVFTVSVGVGSLDIPVVSDLMQFIALLAVWAMAPVVLIRIAVAYWQNLYGQRGYFTMTLPVSGGPLFAVKVVYACMMTLLVMAVMTLGLVVLAATRDISWSMIIDGIHLVIDRIGAIRVVALVVIMVVLCVSQVVQAAAVITCSAHARFHRLGSAAPVIGLVLLYLFNQVLSLVGMMFIPPAIDLTSGELVARIAAPEMWRAIRDGADPQLMGIGSIILVPVSAVVLAIVAVRQINRHTSLV